MVPKQNGHLTTDLFIKSTDCNTLLHRRSFHPPRVFQSVPKSQLIRVDRIVSDPSIQQVRSAEMVNKCTQRGYASQELDKPEKPTAPGQKIERYEDVTSLGKEFVTVFMQNHDPKETPQLELLVTGTKPSTSVSVTINKSDFRKDVKVGEGETVSIPITTNVEMSGSDTSPSSLVIKSDVEVTIVSRSYKYGSSDTALLYPVRLWGVEYYIITPPWGADGAYPEFSVITHENPTVVNIDLKGAVSFQGKNYPKDSKLTLTLKPFQAVQIQSTDDLSGTKVVADHPVAVLSGHTCSQKNGDCGHVYEQLLPVTSWGYSFFVPGMSFQPKSDIVFIIPAKDTEINYQSGSEEEIKKLLAGEVLQLEVSTSSPLNINADSKLQVLFFGTGGTFNSKPFDPFLTNVPATERFGIAYELIGQDKFETNLAVFVIKTSDKPGITVDGKLPEGVKWKEFPGSEYSWGEYNYGSGFSYHTVEHPTVPFGLLSIGYSPSVSYGSLTPCIKGPGAPGVGTKGSPTSKASTPSVKGHRQGPQPPGSDPTLHGSHSDRPPTGPLHSSHPQCNNPHILAQGPHSGARPLN
ncbi:IgGFc-binding protein-like [Bombina bombina]|uniref:IgGFc-binding protein-like n=1 Tax=Bombina bombina TaxID=8345 RepID=UPI00235A7942|nr:IgGFc-binding protein-like [Bombina bombina]